MFDFDGLFGGIAVLLVSMLLVILFLVVGCIWGFGWATWDRMLLLGLAAYLLLGRVYTRVEGP